MSERDDFVAALFAAPDDDAVKLVFADWLDEHDEPRAAERLRWWCAERRVLRGYMLNEQSPTMSKLPASASADDYRWRLVGLTACLSIGTPHTSWASFPWQFEAKPFSWEVFRWPEGWSGARFAEQLQRVQTTIEITLLEVLPWMELMAVREALHELLECAEHIREYSAGELDHWVQAYLLVQSIQRLLAVTQEQATWEYWLENSENGANRDLRLRYERGLTWLFARSTTAAPRPDSGPA